MAEVGIGRQVDKVSIPLWYEVASGIHIILTFIIIMIFSLQVHISCQAYIDGSGVNNQTVVWTIKQR